MAIDMLTLGNEARSSSFTDSPEETALLPRGAVGKGKETSVGEVWFGLVWTRFHQTRNQTIWFLSQMSETEPETDTNGL